MYPCPLMCWKEPVPWAASCRLQAELLRQKDNSQCEGHPSEESDGLCSIKHLYWKVQGRDNKSLIQTQPILDHRKLAKPNPAQSL